MPKGGTRGKPRPRSLQSPRLNQTQKHWKSIDYLVRVLGNDVQGQQPAILLMEEDIEDGCMR